MLIWDVHRLVELARGLPVEDLPLTEIAELDEPFWFAAGAGEEPTCRAIAGHAALIAETDLRYPILLSADGRVMDGMHRVCKALLSGAATIRAVRFPIDPEPDYRDLPADALPYDSPPW